MSDPGVTKQAFSVKRFRAAFTCTGLSLRLYMEISADSGWMMLPTPDSDVPHAGLGQSTGYMEPSFLPLDEMDGFLSHTDSQAHHYFHTQTRTSYSQVPGKKKANSSPKFLMEIRDQHGFNINSFNQLVLNLCLRFVQ